MRVCTDEMQNEKQLANLAVVVHESRSETIHYLETKNIVSQFFQPKLKVCMKRNVFQHFLYRIGKDKLKFTKYVTWFAQFL